MANQSGRPIAPARKLMAAVLGTIAVFVMLFGLGLSSWSIVALGVALLALSIALAMVNVVRRGARAWVAGTVQVKAVSQPPASSVYGRAELSVVVIAPGLPIQEVTIRDPRVPVEKWPRPGDTLPVNVDVDDMRRVRINWDEAPSRADSPDLNPPPPAYDLADDEDLREDDDLLGDPEPPPWAARDRQWGLGPDEPPPAPAPRVGEDMDDAAAEGPVVVHDTPAGPILEGELVGHDNRPGPLPQRARPAPGQARPSGARPSPHPRTATATATATVDPEADDESRPTTDFEGPVVAAQSPPPATRDHDLEIDLALEGDPEPAPETTAAAEAAMAGDIIAPPADSMPSADPEAPSGDGSTAVNAAGPWADLEGGFEPDERTDDLITAYPSARPGPAGAIHGVGITVLVTNLERSIAFYRDVLGFFEIDSGTTSAVLASGDTRLVLRTVHDLATEAGRLIYLNLEVGDVEAVYEELKSKGVPFVHGPRPVNRGDKLELWAASFSDPDKHNIAITQWRAIR